jgi:hypothetical protein
MTEAPSASIDATQPPQSIQRAYWTVIAWVGLSVLSAVVLWTHKDYVRDTLKTANAKAKNKQDLSTAAKLDHAVNSSLTYGLVQILIVGALIVVLAMQLRRGRVWARWGLLILAVWPLFGMGVLVQLVGGLTVSAPGDYKVVSGLAGLCALALIFFLLQRDTGAFFAARRGILARPAGIGLFGTARRQVQASRAADAQAPAVESVPDEEPAADPADPQPPRTDPGQRPRSGAKPKTSTSTPRSSSTGRSRRR